MLYPKSQSEKLSRQLFAQPPAEYRAAPFWAWNCRLDEATLKEQIDIFERRIGKWCAFIIDMA